MLKSEEKDLRVMRIWRKGGWLMGLLCWTFGHHFVYVSNRSYICLNCGAMGDR